MEQTLEMMRKRHSYFTSLIKEHDIKTAKEFYDKLHGWFELFGIELTMVNEHQCSLCIELEYSDYEAYAIIDDGRAVNVSPWVWWNDNYCANSDINIFEEDKL